MNTIKQTRRMLAMLLVLAMVFSVLPLNVFAATGAGAVDAAIIFSDLHTSQNDYKESTIKGIMGALKNTGLSFSTVTSAGDAFSVNSGSGYVGYPSTITGYIRDGLGNSNIPVYYVWSDHDRCAEGIDKNSGFIYGAGADGIYGTSDDGNYYIYSLSMADLSTNDRYSAGFSSNAAITATIAKFVEDAAKLDQSKPLFIASHQPLFDRRDDNGHALEWCTAINQVAETMDVAFFFGHNHRYDQAGDYYYAKGSTMAVTKPDYSSQNVKLNFTHMCAGYMAPGSTGSTSSTTRQGVAVAIVIYEDSIRYTTYDANGVYTGSYALDQTVTRDFAVTEPELVVTGTASYFVGDALDVTVSCKTGSKVQDVTAEAVMTGYDMNTAGDQTIEISYGDLSAKFAIQVREKIFYDAVTGITVEEAVPGATGLVVSVLGADSAAFQAASGLLGSCAGYEIELENHADGTESAVTMPVPAGVTTPAVYYYGDGSLSKLDVEVSGEGTTVTFSTGRFGSFMIGQEVISEDLENSVVGGGTSYEEKTVYVRVNQFEDGGKYLVIGENAVSNGSPIAYLNNSGSEGWETVSIHTDSITVGSTTYSDGYIESGNANAVWTASGSASSGFTLSNNGRYIGGTDANTLKSSSSQAVKVLYDASAVRLKTASGTTRYLYYSTYGSENWKWTTSANSSTSSRRMWIYKEVTVQVATSSPVTYTLEAADLLHTLTDNTAQLQYTLLADGAAAELPEGGSYSFEVKNDATGIIAGISDQGLITFNNAAGSCFVKISFTWSEGSVYKYVKVTTEADPNACTHSYASETREATCTEAGSVTYTCTICGDSYTEEIPAAGHAYESVVTAPTCTEGGCTTHTCACGDSYVTDETAALGHDYACVITEATCAEAGVKVYTCTRCADSYTETIPATGEHSYVSETLEATCTQDGSITSTCSVCGDSNVQIIPAAGHAYESVVTAPTCTEGGYTTHTCFCGESYVSDEVAALGHDYKAVTVEPTCTVAGSVTYTCACGDSYAESIPATGHAYESVVTVPTCTEGGYTTHTCFCGESYVSDEVAALGHNYETVTVEPTCTEGGYTTYTCSVCQDGYVYDEVAALGHSYETVTVEETCTTGGYATHTCSACGDSYVTDEVAALGHDYDCVITEATCAADGIKVYTCTRCADSYSEAIPATGDHSRETVTVEPTCAQDGSVTATCTVCGDSQVEIIPALGHDYESIVTAPTCTEGGYTTNTCRVCGDISISDEVAALGHDYESTTVEPTCTEKGSVTYTCFCGDSYTEAIPALGHNYESVVTASTCTEAGYTTHTCFCGNSYTSDEAAALGHSYETVTLEPTCTTDGYTAHTCSICGDNYISDKIAALGHSYESAVIAPTCTSGGYTTYTCGICGDSYVADRTEALGHSYEAVVTEPTNTQGGYTTYTCFCGDSYIADETEALENSIVAGGSVYEEKTVYVRVDQFQDGGKYVLVGEDNYSNGNPIAYLNNSGSEGWEIVSINTDPVTVGSVTYSGGYLETDNANAIWTASGSDDSGYTLTNNGRYIGGTDANTLKSGSSEAVKVLYDASAVRLKTASGTARYFYYSTYGSENWKWSTSINSSTSSRQMWIYQEMTIRTAASNPVTYSVEAADVNHILSTDTVQLRYALLADGAAADLPEGGSFSFQVKQDADGIIAGISDQGLITFNNVAGSCYVKVIFTWSEGSVYRYAKITTEPDPNACDHSYERVIVEPTCTESGCTIHTCTACGESYVTDEVAALGHDYRTVTVEATCSKAGSVTTTCAVCGDSHAEEIPATGHSYESAVTAPSCTEGGYTTYTCSACGDSYVSDKVAALEHSYRTETLEATCTENGSVAGQCTVCGDSFEQSIPALGHAYQSVATAPTCTSGGYTTHTCANCGDSYTADNVAALGHNYETVTVAATCTEGGYTTHTCANCGDSYISDKVAALGHSYETVTVAATCTSGGHTTHTCGICGHSYVSDEVAALGHSYTGQEANGWMVYTCGTCGDQYSEQIGFTYTQVSALSAGTNYVITFCSGDNYYALSHAGNKISAVAVTVSGGEVTSEVTEDLIWTYSNSRLGYTSGSTTYNLYASQGSSFWDWIFGNYYLSLSSSTGSTVSFSGNALKVGSRYLNYSNGSVSLSSSSATTCIFAEE